MRLKASRVCPTGEIDGMPNNRQKLVSVIIPVYNASKTLEHCVRSVLAQDYPALQIILLNDGSTDDSAQVCERLVQKDARIEYHAQKNAGCSGARNAALSFAKGDFYLFVDADDTLTDGALKKMLDAIYENDLLIAHYNFVIGNVSSERGLIKENVTYNEHQFLDALIKQPGSFYYGVLWNKLYRGDIIRDNALAFDTRLTWGEDFAFNVNYYRHVHSVRLLPVPVYNYNKSSGGISVRALKNVGQACKIKWLLYLNYKRLCVEKGIWRDEKARIRLYVFNVTIRN